MRLTPDSRDPVHFAAHACFSLQKKIHFAGFVTREMDVIVLLAARTRRLLRSRPSLARPWRPYNGLLLLI